MSKPIPLVTQLAGRASNTARTTEWTFVCIDSQTDVPQSICTRQLLPSGAQFSHKESFLLLTNSISNTFL
jgi:hypothetical protein